MSSSQVHVATEAVANNNIEEAKGLARHLLPWARSSVLTKPRPVAKATGARRNHYEG